MVAYIPTAIFWFVALAYLMGAATHGANILGFSGYRWPEAPLRWQVLDVVYLILDLVVVIGLILGWRVGIVAFFIAAISQIALYTVLRNWVLDVPERFHDAGAAGSLNGLLIFHLATVTLVLLALWMMRVPPG